MPETSQQQYKSVLKSTSLIGGSAFINILIGMIRTKFVAVLLGPTGVGLQNMYQTIFAKAVTNNFSYKKEQNSSGEYL